MVERRICAPLPEHLTSSGRRHSPASGTTTGLWSCCSRCWRNGRSLLVLVRVCDFFWETRPVGLFTLVFNCITPPPTVLGSSNSFSKLRIRQRRNGLILSTKRILMCGIDRRLWRSILGP